MNKTISASSCCSGFMENSTDIKVASHQKNRCGGMDMYSFYVRTFQLFLKTFNFVLVRLAAVLSFKYWPTQNQKI
jgi:hypothetical protein